MTFPVYGKRTLAFQEENWVFKSPQQPKRVKWNLDEKKSVSCFYVFFLLMFRKELNWMNENHVELKLEIMVRVSF